MLDLTLDVLVSAGAEVDIDRQRVVDLGQVVDTELDVDHGADHPRDATYTGLAGLGPRALDSCGHGLHSLPLAASASAPPTISLISWVISAWRAALASRV